MKIISTPLDELIATGSQPEIGAALSERQAMELAYLSAWQGLGQVSPNPLVGAVAVDAAGKFLAAGAHRRYGGEHAEVDLLQRLGAGGLEDRIQGGTIFVTLEPCAHFGKTPPCAEALARLPWARVVFATRDPNPSVNGLGEQCLRQAGIQVEENAEFADICRQLNAPFLINQRARRPFVALKLATTLNGAIARHHSQRLWITGERARNYGHFLRGWYDAILVGSQTVLLDNPELSCRHPQLTLRHPKRIVLDPLLEIASREPEEIALFKSASHDVYIVIGAQQEWGKQALSFLARIRELGVTVLEVPLRGNLQFDLTAFLQVCFAANIASILVEGGAKTARSFVEANLIDHFHLFQAPVMWGGDDIVWWGVPLSDTVSAAKILYTQLTPLKDDWLIDAAVIS